MSSARIPQPGTEEADIRPIRTTLAATAIVVLGGLLAPAAEAGRPERFVEPPYETFVNASCPDSIAPEGIRWASAH